MYLSQSELFTAKDGIENAEKWQLSDADFIESNYYNKGMGREREGYLLFYCLSVKFSETLFVIARNTLSEKLHTFVLQM